jgi:hypothetical protein
MAKKETSMKKYLGLILGLIFVLMLGFTIYYSSKISSKKDEKIIFQTEKNNIEAIDINSESLFKVERDNGKYKLITTKEIPYMQNAVEGLFESASKIEYSSIVEENAKDIAQFGLSEPKAQVKLRLKDNSYKTFNIGKQTPTQDGYYFKEDSKPTIYKVSDSSVGPFMQNANELAEKKIFNDLNKDNVTSTVFTYQNPQEVFENKNGQWFYGNKQLDQEKLNYLYNEIKGVTADKIAAEGQLVNENAEPFIEISFQLKDGSTQNTSLIRKDEENYNIVKQGSNVQYVMSAASFDSYKNSITSAYNELIK